MATTTVAPPAAGQAPWANLPPDVLAAVDKMADFKVRNGESFEALIREKQRNDPRFAFLFDTTSPAHAYYQFRLATLYHAIPQPQVPPVQMHPAQVPQQPQVPPQVPPQAFNNPGQMFAATPLRPQMQPFAALPPAPMPATMQQHYMPHQLPAGLIPPMAGPPAAGVQHGAYYAAPPMPLPGTRMPLQPSAVPQPPAPLSARQCPVGFLATILRERNSKNSQGSRRPASFTPLVDGDLPRALPSRVAPQALIATHEPRNPCTHPAHASLYPHARFPTGYPPSLTSTSPLRARAAPSCSAGTLLAFTARTLALARSALAAASPPPRTATGTGGRRALLCGRETRAEEARDGQWSRARS
mmetsp:Transcript_4154/g.9040  ORF Transcript_4154/g.9040 Transcript_4154/m.9040 type:complete len:357 (-) Transcript_4154:598-1668(-)